MRRDAPVILAPALLAALIACAAVAALLPGLWRLTPAGNTYYAPGYSEKAFDALASGDSEERVLDLLGEPLVRHTLDGPCGGPTPQPTERRTPSRAPTQRPTPQSLSPCTVLWYSRAIGPISENYLLRGITIQGGRVIQIHREIYWD